MPKWFTHVLVAVAVAVLVSLPAAAQQSGFNPRRAAVEGHEYRYQVFVPPGWTAEQDWPVILYLHGSAGRGTDGERHTGNSLGKALRENPERFPFLVVFPQMPEGRFWHEPEMESLALAALRTTLEEFHGDPGRVCLTGVSLGGYGVWTLAATHSGLFAALVPVAGGVWRNDYDGDAYAALAKQVGRTPVWIFHGERDRTVRVVHARGMRDALTAAGGDVRYTEYERMGHPIWDRVYAEPELIPWLLGRRRAP